MKKLFSEYIGLKKEVYIIGLCKAIDGLGFVIGPMFTLLLSTKLGFSATKIALWLLIFQLASMPINIIGGKLADKYNKKLIINICDIASSIIFIFVGLFNITEGSIIIYLIGCTFQQAESASYQVIVADVSSAKDRERAGSFTYLCLNLGMIIAPILGGFLLTNYANLLFIISGVTQFISIIIFDLNIKDTKLTVDETNKYEKITEKTSTIKMFKDNPIIFFYIVILAMSFIVYNQFNYLLPLDMNAAFGDMGSVRYGTVSSTNCITVLLMTSLVTKIISKLDSLTKMCIGQVIEMIGLIMFIVFIRNIYMCVLASFVFTLGEIICTISSNPYYLNRIPANYRGRVTAFADTFVNIVIALGAIGVGKLYDTYGSHLTWSIILLISIIVSISYMILKRFDIKRYPNLYD